MLIMIFRLFRENHSVPNFHAIALNNEVFKSLIFNDMK